jgi:hypothetical protein
MAERDQMTVSTCAVRSAAYGSLSRGAILATFGEAGACDRADFASVPPTRRGSANQRRATDPRGTRHRWLPVSRAEETRC